MIASAYPSMKAPSQQMIDVWHRALGDITLEKATEAYDVCIFRHSYPPSIADFRRAYTEIAFPPLLSPDEALAEVNQAVRQHGNSSEVYKIISPLSAKVLSMIGLWDFNRAENRVAISSEFRKLYESLASRIKEDRLKPGYIEQVIEAPSDDPPEEPNRKEQAKPEDLKRFLKEFSAEMIKVGVGMERPAKSYRTLNESFEGSRVKE